MRTFFLLVVIVLLAYLGLTYYMSGLILHTPDRTLADSKAISLDRWQVDVDSVLAQLPEPEEMDFTSSVDGIVLRGWFFPTTTPPPAPAPECGVVFTHGYSDNRASMLKYVSAIEECNCALLMYDHRGHGESDEAYGSGGVNERVDLLAAVDWLSERTRLPRERIGIIGESWGASTAIQAVGSLSEPPYPAWVLAESPYLNWEAAITERGEKQFGAAVLSAVKPGAFFWADLRGAMDVGDANTAYYGARTQVPVLLLHSVADTFTSPRQSDELAKVIPAEQLTYHALDWGAWHAHNVIWRKEEFGELVADFLVDRASGFCPPVDTLAKIR